MATRLHRMSAVFWKCQNLRCIRYSGGCRRMNAWRLMTWHMQEETGDTTRSQTKAVPS